MSDSKGDPPPYGQTAAVLKAVKPTNFVSIVRKSGSIKGQYAIDPAIKPPFLLTHEEPASDRSNFKAVTGDGEIDLTIWLACGKLGRENKRERATLLVKAENESKTQTVIRVNREVSIPIPFILNVISKNGDIIVHIPRSFAGVLSVTGSEIIHFSDSVLDQAGNLNETDTSKQCFIGDLTEFDDQTAGADAWNGDEVVLRAENGSITVDTDPSPESVSGLPPAIPGRPNVFFELAVDGKSVGRFVCELYDDKMPVTAMLFRKLAKAVDGSGFQGREMSMLGQQWLCSKLVNWGFDESRIVNQGEPSLHGQLCKYINHDQYAWIVALSVLSNDSYHAFGKVVNGLDVLLGYEKGTCAVISKCGLVV